MTSATFPRRQARIAAAAAGLAAALVLAGCSSDDGGDGSGDKSTSPSPSATATADTGGGSGSTSGAKSKLEGSWLATTGGKAVALMVTGEKAALFTTGGAVCSGTAAEESGMRMIRLKCTDGSKDRAVGMVDSVSGTRLKITWEGGLGKESYVKSEGGKMPTELSTAGSGS
ncbi:hypothetical protein [Streptomyces sp. NPDC001530]|uniref:hypothetical protein n=1 Tax=Streptomyces sp. NPDC001530 TaxID=3364582 RepID=UPI0036C2E6DB